MKRTPLRRKKPMVKRRPRRIDRETPEEAAYKAWLHSQACVVTGYFGERIHASHVGEGGMGQKKGSWFDAVPMQYDIHRQWEEHSGEFFGLSMATRMLLASGWIQRTQFLAREAGLRVPAFFQ